MDHLQLIDSKQLAALAGISLQSVRQAASDKTGKRIKLPTITRVGGLVRFRADHVKEWLDQAAGIATASNEQKPQLLVLGRGRPRKTATKNAGVAA